MSAMSYRRFTAELEAQIAERQMKGLPALELSALFAGGREQRSV